MNKEMNSLKKNKTWELVEKPKNDKVIDLRWIHTKKSENVYKARIVVRGYQQTDVFRCENTNVESIIVLLFSK